MSPAFEQSPHRWLAIAAARLRSEGATQVKIAEKLKLSQPEISRLLAYAEEQRFLSRWPTLLRHNISDPDYAEAEQRYLLTGSISERVRPLAPKGLHFDVRVIPATGDDFTFAAAGRVVELIHRARCIGIMWGRTIHKLIDGVLARHASFDPSKTRHTWCIPLCGDPLFLLNQRRIKYSASHLAASLGLAIDGSHPDDLPCLIGVPAYITRLAIQQSDKSGLHWERFLHEIPGYQAIFAGHTGKEPMVNQVDTVITGVGIIVLGEESPDHVTGDFITERLVQEHLSKQDLDGQIYGDIGGLLLERDHLKAKERQMVQELNRGWTGIKEPQLKEIAAKAKPGGPPGIVVVAAGPAKAGMVKEVIRRGYVNELVTDLSLAKALETSV